MLLKTNHLTSLVSCAGHHSYCADRQTYWNVYTQPFACFLKNAFMIKKESGPHCHHVMLYRFVVAAIMRSMKPVALHFIVTRRQARWTAAIESLNRTHCTVCLMERIHLTRTDIALTGLLVAAAGAFFVRWWMIGRALWHLTLELSRGVWVEWTAALGLVFLYLVRTHRRFCAVTVWRTQRNFRDVTVNIRVTSSQIFSMCLTC